MRLTPTELKTNLQNLDIRELYAKEDFLSYQLEHIRKYHANNFKLILKEYKDVIIEIAARNVMDKSIKVNYQDWVRITR